LVLSRHLGSWGVVYVVRELDRESAGRPEVMVAKAMRPQFAADKDRMNRFEQECNYWLSIGTYKHTVRLFFVDRFDSQVLAFGEYVKSDGLPNTLRGWLDDNLVELEFALRFGLHILWALGFARGRGLIAHLDLKPENVLVTPAGVAKVTDWGLSRMVPAEVKAPAVLSGSPYRYIDGSGLAAGGLGTRGYAAPEVAAPGYVPAPAADLFSFAVMLGEMLTGQRPSAGTGAAGLLPALNPLGRRHQVSVADQLAACLSARPQDRPQSTDELISTLAAAFEELTGVPAEPVPGRAQEKPSDLGQRAYGLLMLGRSAEGLALQAEAIRRVTPDKEKSGQPMTILMDYKEHGWKLVTDETRLTELENAMHADPANPEPLKSAISFNKVANRLDHALELCHQLLELTPDDPAALQQCAGVLVELGRRREALDCLDRSIAIEPDASRWLDRAQLLTDEGDPAQALRSYERAAALDRGSARALTGLGVMLARTGDHKRAVQVLRRAVKKSPSTATAWYTLGASLYALNPHALNRHALNRHALNRHALNRHALNRRKRVRAAVLKALEADPGCAPALNLLGVLAQQDGDEQAALAYFRRATSTDPGYAKGWFNAGTVYEVAEQFGKAREAYERALDIDPDYALAKAGLDRLAEMGW
jgi:tetratricopeptide (TPR) repeat protein